MDYDLIIIPSYIIYALGLQWAWQFNTIFQPLNIGFDSYCDHYIISMINKKWIDYILGLIDAERLGHSIILIEFYRNPNHILVYVAF